ncbi:hypothetical protein C8F01DRAFT_1254163 [Mycena amicta]|nr:hypothetical protein C8F01DRAFT_1254163 [Mycena amicta]
MPATRPEFLTRFFSTPPTQDDPIRMRELQHDPQLPHGTIYSFIDALNDKHWQITLLARIVAIVDQADERYMILEALPSKQLGDDFQELLSALVWLQERTRANAKCVDSWARAGPNGLLYVHITSTTRMGTYAWNRDEPWMAEATLIQPALSQTTVIDPVEVGAAVFCVANLLRINNVRHTDPEVLSSQWVIKCSSLFRLHLPTAGATSQNSEMTVFLSCGWAPGRGPLRSSEELPVRADANDP